MPTYTRPAVVVLVCVILGIVTVLTLPSLPGYDPFAWIVWGRELAHRVISPSEPFIVGGGPSWKPLPVLFTTVFGFFGSAPQLWVVLARAAGLLGLFLAYRVGSCLAATPSWRLAGPVAGVLAALGVFLTSEWLHYMLRGTSEPMVVTATLLGIGCHLAGRRTAAFLSGVALVLMRPEAVPFVLLYALWLFFADPRPRTRLVLLAGVLVAPAGWLVPPWLASGKPLLASIHARAFNGQLGQHPFLEVLRRASHLTVWPVLIAALAVTLQAIRTRDRVILALAAVTVAYVGIVELMTLDHYPGLERFLLPAAAIACVLAGVAVARFAALAPGALAPLAVVAVLVAAAVPFFAGRFSTSLGEKDTADRAVRFYDQLVAAVRWTGGSAGDLPCPTSKVAINHTAQTSLAWALGVPLTTVLTVTNVNSSLHRPALAFFAPRNPVTGGAPTAFVGGLRGQPIAQVGTWKIIQVTRRGDRSADACVGR